MATYPPPNNDWNAEFSTAQEKFHALRRQFTRQTYNQQEFILVSEITRCLQGKSESCPTWYKSDLQWLCASAHHSHYDSALDFDELERKYLTIFYILLDLGYAKDLHRLRQLGLDDSCLPISGEGLDRIRGSCDIANLRHLFDEQQYAWCPMIFDLDMDKHYYKRIIPLVQKQAITRKGVDNGYQHSTVWKVGVPEELVGEALREKLKDANNQQNDGHNDGTATFIEFVLKRFPSSMETAWSRESTTNAALKKQDGVLQCFGWFRNLEQEERISPYEEFLYIVLESGEMDLYTYMTEMEPPETSNEVLQVWEMMLNVTCGLKNIHRIQSSEFANIMYNGCHGDIKPENLVAVKGLFKIADAGEARVEVSKSSGNPETSMTGGTLTYASPEKSQILRQGQGISRRQRISVSSDIWSLGCVFSDVATWVVFGRRGFITYNKLRMEANQKRTGVRSDNFHGGITVLPEVTKWHRYLREAARGTDRVTPRILDIVDRYMLVADGGRSYAADIVKVMAEKIEEYKHDEAKSLEEFCDLEAILMATINEVPSVDTRPLTGHDHIGQPENLAARAFTGLNQGNRDFMSSRDTLLSQPILQIIQRNDPPHVSRAVSQVSTLDTGLGSYSFETKGVVDMWMVEAELEKMQISKNLAFLKAIRRFPEKSVKGAKSRSKCDELESFSKDRDIVFLVDNSPSMLKHWKQATYLIRILAWRALGYDENGMELYFTDDKPRAQVEQKADQKVADFVRAMEAGKPRIRMSDPPRSMTGALVRIFDRYNKDNNPRPMTIIILTDGVWENIYDDGAVDQTIRNQIQHLINKGYPREELFKTRPLTFQFIRFGDHPEGMKRLERLDDHLEDEDTPDLVDTEPATGDIYKMFLGSLSKEMDDSENIVNSLSRHRSSYSSAAP